MIFQLQRFAVEADDSAGWTIEEISTNRWKATDNNHGATVTISGVSYLNTRSNGMFLIATLAGELKDVTYTLDCDADVDLQIGDETYTMKAGVTDGKFVRELPEFGLMTKADKQKLDGIDTSTLLTKTEAQTVYLTHADAAETYLTISAASNTYATKAEMREYIKQILESDDGLVFVNGNNSEVGVIPVM